MCTTLLSLGRQIVKALLFPPIKLQVSATTRLSCGGVFEDLVQSSLEFLCMLTVAVVRFSCGGVAIRYVLPVLWVASCLHMMARNRR